MVYHVGIGDRQDDAGLVDAEPGVKQGLEVDDVGCAVGGVLVVHAVIGGGNDDRPLLVELGQVAVDHGVKVVGQSGAGSGLVLDVVGGRQIHQVGTVLGHQAHPGSKHELR